jgi:3'(2'), 5'-bisphosphate nucleotidase
MSRSHHDWRTEKFVARIQGAERRECGSSLKFCRVAEGKVDLYPRLAPTHEWDVAAGHAITAAAGGIVIRASGNPLVYGQFDNNFIIPDFIACGDTAVTERWFPPGYLD